MTSREGQPKTVYRAAAVTGTGRGGKVRTDDGRLEMAMTVPKEMGGPGGEGTNPEQLFACGIAACFRSSLGGASRELDVRLGSATVRAQVGVHESPGNGFSLVVALIVELPELSSADAQPVVDAAQAKCPYVRAIRGNVPLTVKIEASGDNVRA